MRTRLGRPSPSLVISIAALFVALGGTSYAAITVTGKSVKDSSLTGKDIKNSSIGGADVKDKSLTSKDFKGSVKGATGATGPRGATGATGANGANGTNGISAALAASPQGDCDPGGVAFANCATVNFTLDRTAKLLLQANASYHRDSGTAIGRCRFDLDGTAVTNGQSELMGTTDTGGVGSSFEQGYGFSVATDPVAAGSHTVTLQCNQTTGDIHFVGNTISVVGGAS